MASAEAHVHVSLDKPIAEYVEQVREALRGDVEALRAAGWVRLDDVLDHLRDRGAYADRFRTGRDVWPNWLTEEQMQSVVGYLAERFGPDQGDNLMAKVTIRVEHGGCQQIIQRSTPPLGLFMAGGDSRQEAARMLLVAFCEAAKMYQAEIADELTLLREMLAAFGCDLTAAKQAAEVPDGG